MLIYIIRHPETEYNARGITQGHYDSSLTNKGKKTAEFLGKKLKSMNISKIYTSDFGRCVQTSEIVNKELNVKVILKKELREQDFGDYNGKKAEIIASNLDMSNSDLVIPNGESFNQMKKRVLDFIKNLKENNQILIVAHDGCLRAILSEILRINFSSSKLDTFPEDIFILDKEKNKITRI